jgi:hypothetical protein
LNAEQAKLFELSPLNTNQASLQWSPNGNTGIWDVNSSANWINLSNQTQTVFNNGNNVLFDDTVNVPTTVNVSGTVLPSLITVNSSTNNFTIQSGAISGSGSLLKEGTSILTILNPDSFTGAATIKGGAVYAGNNAFDSLSSITVTNGATLDMAGGTFNDNMPITVSGSGFNGEGALYNSYADFPLEALMVAMTGDTTFGGTARWDMATGSQISGAHHLTMDWSANTSNPYGEWNSVMVGAEVLSITLTNGSKLGSKGMDTAFQNPATVFTVQTNCQLIFWSGGWNGSLHIENGGYGYLWSAPSAFNGSTITLDNNAQWISTSGGSNDEPINSTIMLNGVAHFVLSGHNIDYTNVISGPGGFVLDQTDHTVILTAANTYTGPTIIGSSNGIPYVALTGNGSIADSSLIFFGMTNAGVEAMDVSGRSDQTLTLANGQMLEGMGGVNGSLAVSTGATVSPGGTNTTIGITTGGYPVGTLAVSGKVTLNGTTMIKLDGTSNDVIEATGTIKYGGRLNLANISGVPLEAGNSFQIFNATSYSGSFGSITPATPGGGLTWDKSRLGSGIIGVMAGKSGPVPGNVHIDDGNFIFSGTGGPDNGTYYVLTSTNLLMPLPGWMPIATNTYDNSGNFSVTDKLNANNPQMFYIIEE